MPSPVRSITRVPDRRISRRRLAATLALGWVLGGCGGSDNAPFFKNAFGDKPVVQNVPMVHGFTVLLVDEVPSRTESTFTVRFKASEPLTFDLVHGHYQEGAAKPRVEVDGKQAEMDHALTGSKSEVRFSVTVSKVAGKETKSSHQVRLEVFGNGPLDSTAVTPVELEISGPPGSRWHLDLHSGPARAASK
jgi:hypothetical protein